jgi:hypothetical protein
MQDYKAMQSNILLNFNCYVHHNLSLKVNALITSNKLCILLYSQSDIFLCIVENFCVDYMDVPGFEL